jgi:hypothetical protein
VTATKAISGKIAGFKGIAGLPPEVLGPRGRYLTGLMEPCGPLPRKCSFIYLFRNGREGRILFTLIDSYHSSLRDQPVKVEVSYRWGYNRIGMGDRYTLMMLANELWVLTHNKWNVYPKQPHQTRADGTICHETYENRDDFFNADINNFALIPEKLLSTTPRGSVIRYPPD